MSQSLKPRDTEMTQGNSVDGPAGVEPRCPVQGVVAGGAWGMWALHGLRGRPLVPVSRKEPTLAAAGLRCGEAAVLAVLGHRHLPLSAGGAPWGLCVVGVVGTVGDCGAPYSPC